MEKFVNYLQKMEILCLWLRFFVEIMEIWGLTCKEINECIVCGGSGEILGGERGRPEKLAENSGSKFVLILRVFEDFRRSFGEFFCTFNEKCEIEMEKFKFSGNFLHPQSPKL